MFNTFTYYAGNYTGPLVPGMPDKVVQIAAALNVTLPISNIFYSLSTVGDFPAGGLQPGSFSVHKVSNERYSSRGLHTDHESCGLVPDLESSGARMHRRLLRLGLTTRLLLTG